MMEPGSEKFNEEQARVSSDDTRKNLHNFIIGIVVFIVICVVGTAGVGLYRVYAQGATDSFSLGVARALRLPVAKVNGQTIAYTEYADDLKAINVMAAFDKANNGPGKTMTEDEKSDQVLWRLVNNILIKQAAKEYNLTVDQKDIDDVRTQILSQFKTEAEADQELSKRYGWNFKVYEDKVVKPYVLQNKLSNALELDVKRRSDTQALAEKVLNEIKGGADFSQMAKQYGQDGTAAKGGDLGWFARGEMVPQFEEAAFALKKGAMSQQLVESPYGYHIIKVDDRRVQKTKDPKTGKVVNEEQIKARHILFRFVDLEKYMDTLARQADIHLYAHVHNPFKELNTPAAQAPAATGASAG